MPRPIIAGPYRTFRDLNPGETYVEYEGSTITIPIQGRMPGGDWVEERLKLSAFMRLEVFPAYINGLGSREFQFVIRDWELYGYSPLLNQLFMGDERGYLAPGADPREGREQAVMTFTSLITTRSTTTMRMTISPRRANWRFAISHTTT